MIDAERLQLALKITETAALEGLWNQGEWFQQIECGTAGCMAGHWALHQGCSPAWDENGSAGTVILPDGRREAVAAFVATDLGLSREQADELFAIDNTMGDLRRIVGELVGSE